MKTKRKVGERVRLLHSHHPAMQQDLINMMIRGKEGTVTEVSIGPRSITVTVEVVFPSKTFKLVCDPRSLRGATS